VHPTREFARRHFGCAYGKTEAWVILDTKGAEPLVHIGFHREVQADELADWTSRQDRAAILSHLNALTVSPGDTVYVPAGTPHAIGAGVFCLELQEPTDFSLMLEWSGFDGLDTANASLGLDAETARECVRHEAITPSELDWLRGRAGRTAVGAGGIEQLFPQDADAFFRAERIRASALRPARLDAGFSVLVGLHGQGSLHSESQTLEIRRGATLVVPHSAGALEVRGPVVLLRCRPPSVAAALAGGLIPVLDPGATL
jgi:mannose-6-phosphate isomerase